jgi:diguanylate cyclase (GGDEF)-like protein
MNPSGVLDLPARPATAGDLAAALGVAESALCDVLLAWMERGDVLLSIKDVASGRYVHVSGGMAALLGRPAGDVVGLSDADLMESEQWAALRAADQAAGAAFPVSTEHRLERGGQRREFRVSRQTLAVGGAPRFVVGIWTEITAARLQEAQLKRALEQIESLQRASDAARAEVPADAGLRDGETGLYQRGHFEDQLRREVDLSSREHREFALVSITLDPVSAKVRELGPVARKRILEALGRLLRSNTRAMDASCRLDEDRFAVLLSGVGLATAHSRMEGLRRQCATQIVMVDGQELGFSVSMGVASFPHTALSQEELLQASETALTEAQRRGGNHVTLASIRFEPG